MFTPTDPMQGFIGQPAPGATPLPPPAPAPATKTITRSTWAATTPVPASFLLELLTVVDAPAGSNALTLGWPGWIPAGTTVFNMAAFPAGIVNLAVGQSVLCQYWNAISAGATIASITPTGITLSVPLAADLPQNTPVDVTDGASYAAIGDGVTGSRLCFRTEPALYANLKPGMKVSGEGINPDANVVVASVIRSGQVVTVVSTVLNEPALTAPIVPGTAISFAEKS